MSEQPRLSPEAEIAAIVARLREEVHTFGGSGAVDAARPFRARLAAQRLWGVTAERPYLSRPGAWGAVRGLTLRPLKAVLRRLMRWYVEPLAVDQRAFNAAVLRLADEIAGRLADVEERLELLERAPSDADETSAGRP